MYYHIQVIEKEARVLKRRGHLSAASEAKILAENLRQEIENYRSNSEADLLHFKAACGMHIKKASKALEPYCGWKELLGNALLFVATLGVGYLAMASVNKLTTGHFLFFKQTHGQAALLGAERELGAIREDIQPQRVYA